MPSPAPGSWQVLSKHVSPPAPLHPRIPVPCRPCVPSGLPEDRFCPRTSCRLFCPSLVHNKPLSSRDRKISGISTQVSRPSASEYRFSCPDLRIRTMGGPGSLYFPQDSGAYTRVHTRAHAHTLTLLQSAVYPPPKARWAQLCRNPTALGPPAMGQTARPRSSPGTGRGGDSPRLKPGQFKLGTDFAT